MKTTYIKLLSLVAAMILSSCGGGKATYLTFKQDAVKIGIDGGSGSVEFDCDGKVDVVYAPEWVNVKVGGSKLKYSIDNNTTGTLRKDYVVIKSGEFGHAIKFSQATNGSYLLLPKAQVTIEKDGKGGNLEVLTDGSDVKVTCPEGVTYSYNNGVLSFSSKGHKGSTKRLKATVTCNELSQNITIVQKGDFCNVCRGRGRVTCSRCGGQGVVFFPYDDCPRCWGKKTVTCGACGGRGK